MSDDGIEAVLRAIYAEHGHPDDWGVQVVYLESMTLPLAAALREAGYIHRDLLPAESIALTVGLAQVLRGDGPGPNVAAMCVLALARLDGRHDWTAEATP